MSEVKRSSSGNPHSHIVHLLTDIEEATQNMSETFEETILRHEQQFMKVYKVKIYELIKLFEDLKNSIEDSFINNTLTLQLETVIKERDYFKYECLKLNSQYQSLIDQHKNTTATASNHSEEISIFKHLLQNEKLKNQALDQALQELKKTILTQDSKKPFITQQPTNYHSHNKQPEVEKQNSKLRRDLKEKNEIIRALRERVQELQRIGMTAHQAKVQKKELQDVFRSCVESWKRQSTSKGTKTPLQLRATDKKQLLRALFTHSEFLKFVERLLFEDGFRVSFESAEGTHMMRNRSRLLEQMTRQRVSTPKLLRPA